MVPIFRLLRRLAQQVLTHAECREQLIVQIIAICQYHQRGVLHNRMLDNLASVEGHKQAFARSLRVPDHPDLAVTILSGRHQRMCHSFPQN